MLNKELSSTIKKFHLHTQSQSCMKNTSFKTLCSMFMGASLAEPHAHDLMMWLQDEDYRHQVKCNRSSYSVELGRNRTDLFASFKFVLSSKCRQFFFSLAMLKWLPCFEIPFLYILMAVLTIQVYSYNLKLLRIRLEAKAWGKGLRLRLEAKAWG